MFGDVALSWRGIGCSIGNFNESLGGSTKSSEGAVSHQKLVVVNGGGDGLDEMDEMVGAILGGEPY